MDYTKPWQRLALAVYTLGSIAVICGAANVFTFSGGCLFLAGTLLQAVQMAKDDDA